MILNSYNIGRSLLATGLLLTLTFNSNYTLFGLVVENHSNILFDYNLFSILKDNLLLAKTLSILVLITVILGFYPRVTGILQWYITYSFFMSADVVDGGDHIASNLTLLLIPLTLIDNNKNHWFENNTPNKIFTYLKNSIFLLISIQVCAIYLHAFIGKLFVEEWKNGTAIYYWLTHNHFGVNPIFKNLTISILSNKFIVILITWGTLLLEFLLSSCILLSKNDKKRYLFLFLGIIFHFSIIIIHGLVSFFFTMSAALFLYLIPNNKNYLLKQLKNKKTWKQFLNQF